MAFREFRCRRKSPLKFLLADGIEAFPGEGGHCHGCDQAKSLVDILADTLIDNLIAENLARPRTSSCFLFIERLVDNLIDTFADILVDNFANISFVPILGADRFIFSSAAYYSLSANSLADTLFIDKLFVVHLELARHPMVCSPYVVEHCARMPKGVADFDFLKFKKNRGN